MTHLFDLGDYEQPPPKAPVHACAGAYCRVCASSSSGSEAKRRGTAAVKRDEAWWADAALFLDGLDRQEIFTVDDLRESIGEPQGSGNQFGSVIRGWAAADKIIHHGYRPSRIKSNHGHMVRVWRKA